jgi:hypothetical protein
MAYGYYSSPFGYREEVLAVTSLVGKIANSPEAIAAAEQSKIKETDEHPPSARIQRLRQIFNDTHGELVPHPVVGYWSHQFPVKPQAK